MGLLLDDIQIPSFYKYVLAKQFNLRKELSERNEESVKANWRAFLEGGHIKKLFEFDPNTATKLSLEAFTAGDDEGLSNHDVVTISHWVLTEINALFVRKIQCST